MNPYLPAIVCNDPTGSRGERGAGRSLRPSLFSGRGTRERDIDAGHLAIIYEGIRGHEALEHFPSGASEAFALMVLRLPAITGTAFTESLLSLDACDYVFGDRLLSTSSFAVDADDGTGSRERTAMAGVFAVFAGPCSETPEQMRLNSVSIKREFLRRINRDDLRDLMWKPKPVRQSDGTWFDGERSTYEDPDAPKVDPACCGLAYELAVAAADHKYGYNRGVGYRGGRLR